MNLTKKITRRHYYTIWTFYFFTKIDFKNELSFIFNPFIYYHKAKKDHINLMLFTPCLIIFKKTWTFWFPVDTCPFSCLNGIEVLAKCWSRILNTSNAKKILILEWSVWHVSYECRTLKHACLQHEVLVLLLQSTSYHRIPIKNRVKLALLYWVILLPWQF